MNLHLSRAESQYKFDSLKHSDGYAVAVQKSFISNCG